MRVDRDTYVDLRKCPHILVGGSTGSGKSYLMKSMLCDILSDSSGEYRVVVIDPKSVDYMFLLGGMRPYEGRSGLRYEYSNGKVRYVEKGKDGENTEGKNVVRVVDEDDEVKRFWSERGICLLVRDDIDSLLVSKILKGIVDDMGMRYSHMRKYGFVDWSEYMEDVKENESIRYCGCYGDVRIVIFIDELADLIYWDRSKTCEILEGYSDGSPEYRVLESEYWKILRGSIEKYLMRLSMLGRASGIHLVLGTQRPSSEVLSGQLRANIPTRICLRTSNPIERSIILGNRCKDLGERVLYYRGEYKELIRDLK